MRTLNAMKQVRELVPDGYSLGRETVLAGCKIFNEKGDYLGYWHRREMPNLVRRQLERELAANWYPANYDRDAL